MEGCVEGGIFTLLCGFQSLERLCGVGTVLRAIFGERSSLVCLLPARYTVWSVETQARPHTRTHTRAHAHTHTLSAHCTRHYTHTLKTACSVLNLV